MYFYKHLVFAQESQHCNVKKGGWFLEFESISYFKLSSYEWKYIYWSVMEIIKSYLWKEWKLRWSRQISDFLDQVDKSKVERVWLWFSARKERNRGIWAKLIMFDELSWNLNITKYQNCLSVHHPMFFKSKEKFYQRSACIKMVWYCSPIFKRSFRNFKQASKPV